MAEGSFGFKATGSAFYQLKQSGNDNVNLLKAALLLITGSESNRLFNPDSKGGYQLSLSSMTPLSLNKLFYFFHLQIIIPYIAINWINILILFLLLKRVNGIVLSQLNLINKILLDIKNEMYELVSQMYSLYLNFFRLLIGFISKGVSVPTKVSRLKCTYKVVGSAYPHNIDILSLIFGSLLGEAQAEKKIPGTGTRITFYQEGLHVKYILFLHKMFSDLGYCNPKIPVITTRLGRKGKIIKMVRFST